MTYRKPLHLLVALAAVAALGAVGCSDDDDGDACGANLLPGDLVITEVMPNPNGADDGKEWFEVYNATTGPIDLSGVTLVYSRTDGTNRKTHEIAAGTIISAGEYMVFGGMLEIAKPDYVDYAYGGDLGSLTNTGGKLAVECNTTLVDEIVYLEGSDGVSLAYDGDNVPDAVENDTLDNWCDSVTEYETGSFGTPGEANDPCEGDLPPNTCLDNGTSRAIVPPQAGDVIISEVMADSSAIGDTDGEWFEVYFAQAADLNGLQLGDSADATDTELTSDDCIHVEAGTYAVFARNAASATSSGIPNVMGEFGFALNNSDEDVVVSYNNVVLDQIHYASSTTGAALALDPDHLSATDNDVAANWCDAVMPYSTGDLGTPGEANTSCSFVPCEDPTTHNIREVNPPTSGNVIITEFLADPDAVAEQQGEFIEVYFSQATDLNGLQLGDSSQTHTTIDSWECLPVSAGTYVVFARDSNVSTNGGIPNVAAEFSFALNNSGTESIWVAYGGTHLDDVTYTQNSTGASRYLGSNHLSATENDTEANWCDSTTAWSGSAGDFGSPGAANGTCP